jgi:hypothetical protein
LPTPRHGSILLGIGLFSFFDLSALFRRIKHLDLVLNWINLGVLLGLSSSRSHGRPHRCGSKAEASGHREGAEQGKIQHTVHTIRFEDINDALDRIRTGEIVGRAVIKY